MLMKTIFHGPKEKEHSRANRTEPKFDIEPKFVIPTDFYGSLWSDSNKEKKGAKKISIERINLVCMSDKHRNIVDFTQVLKLTSR